MALLTIPPGHGAGPWAGRSGRSRRQPAVKQGQAWPPMCSQSSPQSQANIRAAEMLKGGSTFLVQEKLKSEIHHPVALGWSGAPVVVLQVVAYACGGARAAAVNDRIGGDDDGPGGRGGGDCRFQAAEASQEGVAGLAEMAPGNQLGGPHLPGGAAGVVEHLQGVQPRGRDGAGVRVPGLGRAGALNPVAAHDDRQEEIPDPADTGRRRRPVGS